jgi:hypothetical protein
MFWKDQKSIRIKIKIESGLNWATKSRPKKEKIGKKDKIDVLKSCMFPLEGSFSSGIESLRKTIEFYFQL